MQRYAIFCNNYGMVLTGFSSSHFIPKLVTFPQCKVFQSFYWDVFSHYLGIVNMNISNIKRYYYLLFSQYLVLH